MTTEQRAALEPLRKQFDYLERPMGVVGAQHVECYRTTDDVPPTFKGAYDLQHCGLAVIHTNGFVDWWRAR